jgi:hypothetical protein
MEGHDVYKDCTFHPDPLTNMVATDNSVYPINATFVASCDTPNVRALLTENVVHLSFCFEET